MPAQPLVASRRFLLKASLAVGGGLLLAVHTNAAPGDPAGADFMPNAFVRIDKAGKITLTMRDTEVGQGIFTSIAMLIAEELEVGLDQITAEAAPRTSSATSTHCWAIRRRVGRPLSAQAGNPCGRPGRPGVSC